jgi:hypothetical protein
VSVSLFGILSPALPALCSLIWKHVVATNAQQQNIISEYNSHVLLSKRTGLENREYGRNDPSRWPRGTLYAQNLELTSPTIGGRSVGIVRSRTQATEWGNLKSLVCAAPVVNKEALHHLIVDACETISNHRSNFQRVRRPTMRLTEGCIKSHGGHLSSYYKCTPSAITHKFFPLTFWYKYLLFFFLSSRFGICNCCGNAHRTFRSHSVYLIERAL